MGLFDFFGQRSKKGVATECSAASVLKAAESSLDTAITFASPYIREKVSRWNLENDDLLLILGYIAGYIDAAYQSIMRSAKYDEMSVEEMYLDAIERNLGDIDGVTAYLKLVRSTKELGVSDIGGLQGMPFFDMGMAVGGTDFVNAAHEKKMAFSLAKLLRRDGK